MFSILSCTLASTADFATSYIFGAANVITIPMVWALYPETNQRTLEVTMHVIEKTTLTISDTSQEIDLLFEANSPWNWAAEKHFAQLKEENPDLVLAASRGNSVADAEAGFKKTEHAETQTEERQEIANPK